MEHFNLLEIYSIYYEIGKKITIIKLPVSWLNIHCIKLERSEPQIIQLKYNCNKDSKFNFTASNIRKSVAGRPENCRSAFVISYRWKIC